jgi:hypothetical protein
VNEQTATTFARFVFETSFDDVCARLFEANEDGTMKFGFSAKSIGLCDKSLLESGHDFRDYILEGFVRYNLCLQRATFGCTLSIASYDDNRVDAIVPAVKHYFRASHLDARPLALPDHGTEHEDTTEP